MTEELEYKGLEERVINAETISMIFQSGDKIKLRLGIRDGKPTIDVIMSWGNVFTLGKYESEPEARREYARYQHEIEQGYNIHITGRGTAEIIKPR